MQPLPPAAPILGQPLAQAGPVAQLLDLLRRDPRLGQHLPRQQPRQPARVETVGLRVRRRPSSARACTGSARSTSKPSASSLRQTHRQPVVASIATAETRPRPSSVQRVRLSRSAEKRASTTSPLSGSSTAAWKACLWMSIAAYSIGPTLVDEARSSSAARTEPYDIHPTGRERNAAPCPACVLPEAPVPE
jgi:hypothetical protein